MQEIEYPEISGEPIILIVTFIMLFAALDKTITPAVSPAYPIPCEFPYIFIPVILQVMLLPVGTCWLQVAVTWISAVLPYLSNVANMLLAFALMSDTDKTLDDLLKLLFNEVKIHI